MPPFHCLFVLDSGSSAVPTWIQSGYGQLSTICLLAVTFILGLRLLIKWHTPRKRRNANPVPPPQLQEKEKEVRQERLEESMEQDEVPPSSNQEEAEFKPLYPWTSPPQFLPGPYDPSLYPLPTIRRHSYNAETSVLREKTSSYTRRVSTDSTPISQNTLRGTVTTSSKGWRRNQWCISGE